MATLRIVGACRHSTHYGSVYNKRLFPLSLRGFVSTSSRRLLQEPGTVETRLFINGAFVDAKTPTRISCFRPTDNSLITADIHSAEAADVDDAVAAARAAFAPWAATSPQERAKILHRLADLIEEHSEEFGKLEAVSSGKVLSQTKNMEMPMISNVFRYYAGYCDKLDGESWPADGGFMKIVRHEPLGVCAAITAFNAPLIFLAMKAAPCLAAGNTMILKASEKSPLTSLLFGKLVQKAGFPAGVWNIISGAGNTGALLSSHMDVNKISFTGSEATGKKIAQAAAASNLKRVTLELGGKSPSIIFPDANMDIAIPWCTNGILVNAGQVCAASSRIYVHKDIKVEFLKRIKASFEDAHASIGDPSNETTTKIGPLVDKIQFDKVNNFIQRGRTQGTLVAGGEPLSEKGNYVMPTLFTDTDLDAEIYKEEIFGPVLVVNEFSDEADVVRRANDTRFGLEGAVFTQDINRGLRVASQIESGVVNINCCSMIDVGVPFGGFKSSGWGREGGKMGLQAYTQTKTIFINMTY